MAENNPFDQRFRMNRDSNPIEKPGEDVPVTSLEGGEWSVDHEALIASIGQAEKPMDRALKIRINFFQGKPASIEPYRDDTLRVIRHWTPTDTK